METKIVRSLVILIGVSFQTSVLAILFSRGQIPNIILLIIIIWTIIVGFNKIWPWAIIAGAALDLASFEPVGKNVIFLILISYIMNFFLQRFLTENRAWRIITISFFVVIASALYAFYNVFFTNLSEKLSFILENITIQVVASIILFYICYTLLNKLENFLSLRNFQLRIKK